MADNIMPDSILNSAQRIVIKIGSSLIIDADGRVDNAWLASLCADISELRKQGRDVVIVSSGAVSLGRDILGVGGENLKLQEKQAAAACGQLRLVEGFRVQLAKHDISPAQVLLTIQDSDDRRRFLNARNTIDTLLKAGIIPVINENDTVATSEIRFGDNDRLAARVAQMTGADLLVLLSDIDGLYTANPSKNNEAKHIAEVDAITDDIEEMADGAASHLSNGGMVTKIMAAKIAVASGCHTIIALGKVERPVMQLEEGARYTIFKAHIDPDSARKNWIAHQLIVPGAVVIDDGAVEAIRGGKSLLPAGVVEVEGGFERGDAISIKVQGGVEIGRGVVAYSSQDATEISGCNANDIADILGYSGRNEIIHRNDMVLF